MADTSFRRSTSNIVDAEVTVLGTWKHSRGHWLEQSTNANEYLFQNSVFFTVLNEREFEMEISTRTSAEDEAQYFILRIIDQSGKIFEEEHQIDKFNYYIEDPATKNVGATIIQNIDINFRSFNILRLGPNPKHALNEYFYLDRNNHLHAIAFAADPNTNEVTKFLRSFEKIAVQKRLPPKITFKNIQKTSGWNYVLFWYPKMLSLLQIKLHSIQEQSSKQVFWTSDPTQLPVTNNANTFPIDRSIVPYITFSFEVFSYPSFISHFYLTSSL